MKNSQRSQRIRGVIVGTETRGEVQPGNLTREDFALQLPPGFTKNPAFYMNPKTREIMTIEDGLTFAQSMPRRDGTYDISEWTFHKEDDAFSYWLNKVRLDVIKAQPSIIIWKDFGLGSMPVDYKDALIEALETNTPMAYVEVHGGGKEGISVGDFCEKYGI